MKSYFLAKKWENPSSHLPPQDPNIRDTQNPEIHTVIHTVVPRPDIHSRLQLFQPLQNIPTEKAIKYQVKALRKQSSQETLRLW